MRKHALLLKIVIGFLLGFDFLWLMLTLYERSNTSLLRPDGIIAAKERTLLLTVLGAGLLVIIPTVLTIFYTVYRFREDADHKHPSEVKHHNLLQGIWWGFPSLVVFLLCLLIWKSTNDLDPRKPLPSSQKPMTIQVVALRWKWLFIYPEEGIATVNYVAFPEKTPITFELTAEAPMNSFWIPSLGGQLYAMEGMVNITHLMANTTGDYTGMSAEISGAGFAGMRFLAKSVSPGEFTQWVDQVKEQSSPLDQEMYKTLVKPSEYVPATFYAPVQKDLYTSIVNKYLPQVSPGSQHDSPMSGMTME